MYTYIPWIHKFVMATLGCGISHKDTKYADKCSNRKTKTTQEQYSETTDKYFFQNTVKIAQKKFAIKYIHFTQGPYNKQEKLLHIL
jgi:hypothetical protein